MVRARTILIVTSMMEDRCKLLARTRMHMHAAADDGIIIVIVRKRDVPAPARLPSPPNRRLPWLFPVSLPNLMLRSESVLPGFSGPNTSGSCPIRAPLIQLIPFDYPIVLYERHNMRLLSMLTLLGRSLSLDPTAEHHGQHTRGL